TFPLPDALLITIIRSIPNTIVIVNNPIRTPITYPPLYIIPVKFPGSGSPFGSPFTKFDGLPNTKFQIPNPINTQIITVITAKTFDKPELDGFFSTYSLEFFVIFLTFNVYSINRDFTRPLIYN